MKLNLKKLLTAENIFLDLKGTTKDEIIEEFIDRLTADGRLKNKEAALKAVMDREKKMSTGMENGVAIPHGKTDSVKGLVVALGVNKAGVDFDSLDKMRSTIFVMTISPASTSGPHLQFLAEVSTLLNSAETREKVRAAENWQEVVNIFINC